MSAELSLPKSRSPPLLSPQVSAVTGGLTSKLPKWAMNSQWRSDNYHWYHSK